MSSNLIMPQIRPLWYQYPSWAASDGGCKFKIISYPRRHGKDLEDLSLAASIAFRRKGSYYYVFPTRKWAKRAIWDTIVEINREAKPLIDHIFPELVVERKNETDLFLELKNGSMLFMGGTDNLDFVGQGGQGYTMSEFSLHKEEVTSLLMPIIRQGQAYLHMNGTMRGKDNPLYRIMSQNQDRVDWHSRWLRPSDTKLYCWVGGDYNINPEILPLINKINPATGELYKNVQGVPFHNIQDDIDSGLMSLTFARQEFLNEAVQHITGTYYKNEIDALKNRGGFRSFDPYSKPVYTFWDLGGANNDNDTTAIWFAQMEGNTGAIDIVDYYEGAGHLRGHYFDLIKSKGYEYAGHYMPHDSKKSNAWNGESTIETARRDYGIEVRAVPKADKVSPSIELARREFVNCTFDIERTDQGFTHLTRYHANEATGKPCHKNNCNTCAGASHGADAFRTMVEARYHKMIEPYLLSEQRKRQFDSHFLRMLEKKNQVDYVVDDGFIF